MMGGNRQVSIRGQHLIAFAALVQICLASYPIGDELAEESQNEQRQQGSWSHWWSYDGISGPDYWNINKHWRLCSLGRKQSPVDIRTARLVYDHLLEPFHLHWHSSQARSRNQLVVDGTNNNHDAADEQMIQVKLLNSGRGIEAWLEVGGTSGEASSIKQQQQQQLAVDQLLLSGGPLSYEYAAYKLELHSSSSSSSSSSNSLELVKATRESNNLNKINEDNIVISSSDADEQQQQSNDQIAPEARAKSSEHLVDGRPFEGELQVHFYNKHLAASAHEALRLANEQPLASLFAVISVFVSTNRRKANSTKTTTTTSAPKHSLDPSGDDDDDNNSPLDFILDNLPRVQNQGDALDVRLSRAQLERLVPDRNNYITYSGSMNRPPCAESVDWLVINRALLVDELKFAQLFEKPATNQDNVRPVRPLNGRLLRTTISLTGSGSSGSPTLRMCSKLEMARHASSKQQLNCSMASSQRPQQINNKQCTMKPNYAYHFTYGKATE